VKRYSLNRIKNTCFWDYDFTNDEIQKLAKSKNQRDIDFLFQKIFRNSTRVDLDLTIFPEKIMKEKIKTFKIPKFNNIFFAKRKNILLTLFDIEHISIQELQWKK